MPSYKVADAENSDSDREMDEDVNSDNIDTNIMNHGQPLTLMNNRNLKQNKQWVAGVAARVAKAHRRASTAA